MYNNILSWRGFYMAHSIQRLIRSRKFITRSYVNIYSRRSTIGLAFLGRTIRVHNGQRFFNTKVSRWMIGRKFGEFATTKKLGSKIHESKRNEKRRAKMKRK
jgi:small subunit ribosomal protein S19